MGVRIACTIPTLQLAARSANSSKATGPLATQVAMGVGTRPFAGMLRAVLSALREPGAWVVELLHCSLPTHLGHTSHPQRHSVNSSHAQLIVLVPAWQRGVLVWSGKRIALLPRLLPA